MPDTFKIYKKMVLNLQKSQRVKVHFLLLELQQILKLQKEITKQLELWKIKNLTK